jgi:hypothetical protein
MKKFVLKSTALAAGLACAAVAQAQVNLDQTTPTPLRYASEIGVPAGGTKLSTGANTAGLGLTAKAGQAYGIGNPAYVRVDLGGAGSPSIVGGIEINGVGNNCATGAPSASLTSSITAGGANNNFVVFEVRPTAAECIIANSDLTVTFTNGGGASGAISLSSNADLTARLRVYALNIDAGNGAANAAKDSSAKTFATWSQALSFAALSQSALTAKVGIDFKTALLNGVTTTAATLTQTAGGTAIAQQASTLTLTGVTFSSANGSGVALGNGSFSAASISSGSITLGTGAFSAATIAGAQLTLGNASMTETAGGPTAITFAAAANNTLTGNLAGGISLGNGSINAAGLSGGITLGTGAINLSGTMGGTLVGTNATSVLSGLTLAGATTVSNRYSASYTPYSDFVVPATQQHTRVGRFVASLASRLATSGNTVTGADLAGNANVVTVGGNFTAQVSGTGAAATYDAAAAARVTVLTGDACTDPALGFGVKTLTSSSLTLTGVTAANLIPGAGNNRTFSVCLQPQASTALPVSTYTVAVAPSGVATNVSLSAMAASNIGSIARDGVVLIAPLVQQPAGYISRLVLTNAGSQSAAYTIEAISVNGTAVTLDSSLSGQTLSPNSTSVIDLLSSGGTSLIGAVGSRATLKVTVQGASSDVSGMYQITNKASGAVSNVMLIDKTQSMTMN